MSRCESNESHYLKYLVSYPRSNKVSLIIYLPQESCRTIARVSREEPSVQDALKKPRTPGRNERRQESIRWFAHPLS